MSRYPFKIKQCRIPAGKHSVRLLILQPKKQTGSPAPGVLWIHGGGYQSGSANYVFATRAFSLVVKHGAVVIAPDYRLSKKHPYPAALQDCYAALLFLKNHAEKLGVRSDQIMVGGESAGGGMAAALCIFAQDRGEVNIAFQMPIYPMLDDRDTPSSADNHALIWNTKRNHKAWKRYLRKDYGTDRVPSYAAPARRKNLKGLPPCYTYVGDLDPFFYETVDYVRRLKEAGVEASCDVYHNWFHAYDMYLPAKKSVRLAISRFEAHFEYAKKHYFAPQKEKRADAIK